MKHKQIVLTSDKKPKDMEGIAERLISRFEQGLTVDIQNPDYETRMAILKKKAETSGYNIDEGVLQYIANHFVSNVRELEGSLTRVITFQRLVTLQLQLILHQVYFRSLWHLIRRMPLHVNTLLI